MLTLEQRRAIDDQFTAWKDALKDPTPLFPPTNKQDSELAYKMFVLKHMRKWIDNELTKTEKLAITAGVQCDKAKQEHGPGTHDCWSDNVMRCTLSVSGPTYRLDEATLVTALKEHKVSPSVALECIQQAKVPNNKAYKFEYALIGVPTAVEENKPARTRRTKREAA